MIFATTGTQLPFDRMIRILDEVAPLLDEEIVAQVHRGAYRPQHIKTVDFLPPDEFEQLFGRARLIVAHAGMGTILSALQAGKPIIIFPRVAALGEHRNEHQRATAAKMREQRLAYVAHDSEELRRLLLVKELQPLCGIGGTADEELILSITNYIEHDE